MTLHWAPDELNEDDRDMLHAKAERDQDEAVVDAMNDRRREDREHVAVFVRELAVAVAREQWGDAA